MKVIFSEKQNAHSPTRYLRYGALVDYPESPERVRRLIAGALKAELELSEPRMFDARHFEGIHPKRYLDFLENGHAEWMKLPGAFPEIMPSIRPVEEPSAYPSHILGRAGWHIMDFAGAVTAQTWDTVFSSAMSALTAADIVATGADSAYALCRPPGHHAYGERAGGFCYLNNSALAAQYLRRSHDRVAILDIDVHHGNGTQSIFYGRADVLTVSVHADPATYYPFYYGYAEQQGDDEGEGFNLNLPVPVKGNDRVWLSGLEKAIQRIADFKPGALVLALGLDAHEADPLNGGAVTTEGFTIMARLIAEIGLPTVLVQEGGYLTPMLGDNLAAFLTAFRKAR
ncbi:histone deacetylase family protein [Taklimakanibacter albus]|uniref:Histone deacetylase family protein n=1 Tax=Taklimakanibacter albus TaxID=2800327 RepID=A0ACC5QYR2_9HYPH|nr:histone deacetylase family protein [Aestuariivirga sp. YIM B02566]MBK1865503.1 histone deacetylase family protein [Aestuariivirga sp. YIM B02566]